LAQIFFIFLALVAGFCNDQVNHVDNIDLLRDDIEFRVQMHAIGHDVYHVLQALGIPA
jgi:hypothetical protein